MQKSSRFVSTSPIHWLWTIWTKQRITGLRAARHPEGQLYRCSITMRTDDAAHDHHALNIVTRSRTIRLVNDVCADLGLLMAAFCAESSADGDKW
ncbi:hypothetical protein PoB_001939300 [Plakobranchus ocellatus]|uniref:Uncharacterized protein n=1 Tax=Plakobranchus ocellatus TaxID=259542 RepID=A0AAV3ZEK2_9GAST|nr:hypothetical protein PoB_001939300 [Plakobranchus ocellatus]